MGILGTVPSNGAMAVPRLPEVQVALTEPLPAGMESAVTASLFAGDQEIPLALDAGRDRPGDAQLAFLPTSPLATSTDYELRISVDEVEGYSSATGLWPLEWSSSFSTTVPCGVAFNIADDIVIHSLGGNVALVALLQEALDGAGGLAPIALMFVDTYADQTFPVSGLQLVAGLPEEEGGLYSPDPAFGYPVSVPACDVTGGGALSCEPATFVFPIPITDTTVIYLTISQAMLKAQAASSGAFTSLSGFTLEGVITEADLIVALEAAGLGRLSGYIILDVDLDDDGVMDAASASASSEPTWLDFEGCQVN